MRKTQKSKFYDFFQPDVEKINMKNCRHVIDGGFLLHRVVWHQKDNFNNIFDRYVNYVQKYYAPHSIVVFDGYPDDKTLSTKNAERQRRQTRQQCREIIFDTSMTATVSQEKLLSNDKNKARFITFLRSKLENSGFLTKQAPEDADYLIVETALEVSEPEKPCIIIAEDIDVLVIFIQSASINKNVYFLKPAKDKIVEKNILSQLFCKYKFN